MQHMWFGEAVAYPGMGARGLGADRGSTAAVTNDALINRFCVYACGRSIAQARPAITQCMTAAKRMKKGRIVAAL
jgi:hypothetical protein